MRHELVAAGWLTATLVGAAQVGAEPISAPPVTTDGAIAVENLDHEIERAGDEPEVVDLLLERARLLADTRALDRAVRLTERGDRTADELLRRARVRSAVHRFADALADLDAAERAGAAPEGVRSLRATIAIATGHADDVLPMLESKATQRPAFESFAALGAAYVALGRVADADRAFAAATADLDTTSPFPHAWMAFARGQLWSEQAKDPARGEAFYDEALRYLPRFVAASVHLAEIEAGRGDCEAAAARLEDVVSRCDDPEALALLGVLHSRMGERALGKREIARARQRFEELLARHPLAFADHAAEFYLGPGHDAERAWSLATLNLANRRTPRSVALAAAAARASGRSLASAPAWRVSGRGRDGR
jgi:tetratricopeptide (TPR) repeat protein